MKYNRIVILLIVLLTLMACSRQPKISGGHIVTIEQHSFANTLFYSGIVQPLKTIVVPSPADGVIIEMPFQYGEHVKAGQLLFLISSTKFLTDYKSALTHYVKAKSDFDSSKNDLSEAQFLHKNLLISDDQFKMKKSSFYASRLSLLESKDTLENLLHQLDVKDVNLNELSISDMDKITQAMHLQINSENLRILSPASGIVLSPSKNEEEAKKNAKSDVVKQSDALAVIGDLSGLSVRIKVNELTVNQLKVGQKVKITGIAFPEHMLDGEIKRVDRQAEATGGGLPNFPVEVVVPTLTADQQKQIHVGMSAKVEINVDEDPQIMVPMTAITEKNGESFVKIYDEKAGKIREAAVKTGKTTMDSAAILLGLKDGDKIVVPN